MDHIQRTFAELGITGFRALRKQLLIRTDPIPNKIGSLFVAPKLATLYGEMAHKQLMTGLVLSAGPAAHVSRGDRVAFMRLHFSRWQTLEDGTVVGWIEEANILGRAEDVAPVAA